MPSDLIAYRQIVVPPSNQLEQIDKFASDCMFTKACEKPGTEVGPAEQL